MKARSDLPVELVQHVGDDHMIASAARVSTGHNLKDTSPESDAGLIGFLMRNRHGSPFEHGSLTFRIEAPIFVAREFMRHRAGWSYNEESGRYKVLRDEFYLPGGGRPLVQVGKPGAYTLEEGSLAQFQLLTDAMETAYRQAWESYEFALEQGVAREVARMCLPVGLYTSFYATCNPRSLMHFLGLRTDPSAMHEIREVACSMQTFFRAWFPATARAWEDNGRVAP